MTAEFTNHESLDSLCSYSPDIELVPRSAEEKARILARLTIFLASLNKEGAHDDGND